MKKRISLYAAVIFLIVVVVGIVLYQMSVFEPKPQATEFFTGQKGIELSHTSGNFLLVKGGTFINTKSNLYGKNAAIPDFYISKYEVTQKEWVEVMESNPSQFKGDSLPVETVSWYDCIEYCNKTRIRKTRIIRMISIV